MALVMMALAVLLALSPAVLAARVPQVLELHAAVLGDSRAAFTQWAAQHGRTYKDAQDREQRFSIWLANAQRYHVRNQQLASTSSMQLGLNGMSDLTAAEFRARFVSPRPLDAAELLESVEEGPVSWRYEHVKPKDLVDWRTQKVIGPIRAQHANNWSCGSCWAFATVGIAEASSALGTGGPVIPGSEQQLIDCDNHDHGCDGGAFKKGLNYVIKHGLTKEDDYPYQGQDLMCNVSLAKKPVLSLDSWEVVPKHNESALLQAVTMRPVVTAVCCGDDIDAWHAYKGGVFDVPCCVEKVELDHAMVIVGYGTDPKGGPYWLMKNSWSTSWGEKGFVKMKRNDARAIGHCAVASMPTMAFRGPKPPAPPGEEPGEASGDHKAAPTDDMAVFGLSLQQQQPSAFAVAVQTVRAVQRWAGRLRRSTELTSASM